MAGPPPPPGPPPPSFGSSTTSAPPMPADRNALLASIRQGASLKKTETDDRSAPKVGGGVVESGTSNKPATSAPAVPKSTSAPGGMDLNSMLQNAFNAKKMHASENTNNNDIRNELKIPSAPPIPGAAPSVPPPMPNAAPSVPPPLPTTVAPTPTPNVAKPKQEDANVTPFNPMAGGLPFLAEIQKKRDDVHVVDDSSVPAVSKKDASDSANGSLKQERVSHNISAPPLPNSVPAAPPIPTSVPAAPPLPTSIPAVPPLPTSIPAVPPLPTSIPAAPPLPSSIPAVPPLPTSIPAAPPLPSSIPKAPELPSSTSQAPKIPTSIPKAPELPSSIPAAPPLPTSIPKAPELPSSISAAPALPSSTPQASQISSSIPKAPELPNSIPQAPAIPTSVPKAPPLPSATPTAPPLPSSIPQAPQIPSSIPQAPALPNSIPQAPAIPSNVPVPPSFSSSGKNTDTVKTPPANPLAGGLPFLAEIQKKRDDTYVVDEKNVAAVSKEGASNLKHDEPKLSTGARKPGVPSMPPPIQKSAPSVPSMPPPIQNSAPSIQHSAPSIPSMIPPIQHTAASASSIPSMPPTVQPSAPISQQTEDRYDTGSAKKAPPPPPAVESKSTGNYKTRLFSDGAATSSTVTREGRPDEHLTDSSTYRNKAGMGTQLKDVSIPESTRFKWLTKDEVPIPRPFMGKTKLYPSGRGSSVPLNLKLYG
ncbi:unnamed protein product [Hanseniaspora opuntiae]